MEDFPVLSDGSEFNTNENLEQQQHHHKDHMLAAGNAPFYDTSGKSDLSLLKSDYSMFTNYIQQSALLERGIDPALDNSCLGSICGDLKFPSDSTSSNALLNETQFKNISSVNSEANNILPKPTTFTVPDIGSPCSSSLNLPTASVFSSIIFSREGGISAISSEPKSMEDCGPVSQHFLNLKSNSTDANLSNEHFLSSSSSVPPTSICENAMTFSLYNSNNNNRCNTDKENIQTAAAQANNYLNDVENPANNPNMEATSINATNRGNTKAEENCPLPDLCLRTENQTRMSRRSSSLQDNEETPMNSPHDAANVPKADPSKTDSFVQNLSVHSSDCDSFSSDELIDLEKSERGYQDTTSSHSQHSTGGGASGLGGGGGPGSSSGSGGGGGGGSGANAGANPSVVLLNGVGQPNNGSSGYMSLIPPSLGTNSSSGHIGGVAGGPNVTGGVGGEGGSGGGVGVGVGVGVGGGGGAIDFKHLFEELCPVCGDKVSGYHYGLLTCESCKGFFKRTVQNKKVYTCVAERSCHIDKTQRKRCPFCRFQKCLEVGMKLEAVRADRMRGGRNKFGPMYKRDRARKLQVMRQRQLALQALRTSIGSADMKPMPLSPGYQQAYPNMNIKQEIQIPQISSLTQSPDSSPSPIALALGQVNASTSVITNPLNGNTGSSSNNTSTTNDNINRSGASSCHDGGSGSIQTTSDSKLCFESGTHPTSTADSVIEPLRVSPMIRDFVQSIDDREWQTQLFALLQKQTYNQVEVDLFELMCKVLDQNLFSQVDWARNTVFFKDLKVDDQMKLLQHSWSDMLVLDHLHQRIHNGLPDETQLNNGQVFNLLGLGLLGVPQLTDYFNELQNKLQDLKFDMGDYVCMKFLILLNPDVRGIINKKTVLEGHENVQAALLDYTLTCYPSVTDKFRRLLNILPDIHAMAARGEEHLYSKHCAGSAPTQTLLMEMLHAKRKV